MGGPDKPPLNVWRYEIAPAEGGCDVTESFTLSPTFGLRLYWALWGWSRGKVNRKGMRTTLERIRDEVQDDAGGLGVEDRPSALLHLELGDAVARGRGAPTGAAIGGSARASSG